MSTGLPRDASVLQAVFDACPDPLLVFDDRARVVLVNARTCAAFGFAASAAPLLSFVDLCFDVTPHTEADALALIARAMREGDCVFEWRWRRFDGSSFWAEVGLSSVELDGRPHVLASLRNIDARRRMEEALRESEERFGRIFHSVHTLFAFTDTVDGRIVDVNEAWLRCAGQDRVDVVGRTGDDLDLWADEEDRCRVRTRVAQQGRLGEEQVRLRLGGRVFPAQVSAEPVVMRGTRYLLWEVRDLSERERADAEREALREQLLQSQKLESVGRLAGGIAHDFNNLLAVIQGATDLALTTLPADRPERAELYDVQRSVQSAANLTTQLLAFSRRQVLQPRVLAPRAALLALAPTLRRVVGANVALVLDLPPGLGAIRVDPTSLEQVLLNLVVNGRDAMPRGGRLLVEARDVVLADDEATRALGLLPGPHVRIDVSDSGEGMDEETRRRAFEPFFTTKEPGRGTGLGLATVFGLMQQGGGAVSVESTPGAGSCFRLWFPGTDLPLEAGPAVDAHRPAGRHECVLVVEDEPPLLRLLRTAITRWGYDVLVAADAEEALALLAVYAGKLDLLLTDVMMPGLDGRALAERVTRARPDTRVIFMSGYTEAKLGEHGLLGADVHFLPKPFSLDALAAMLRRALDAPA